MSEYISREAVMSKCNDIWNNADETTQTGVDTINVIDKITDFIENLPAADVCPVTRGRWEYIRNVKLSGTIKLCECSICHNKIFGGLSYCGNCGARMIKDGDTNERG